MVAIQDVAACLSSTLSPDTNTRIAAELKLAAYFPEPDFGLSLSQLTLAQDADIALRQITSIVLRKYILERWSPYFQNFKGSAPPPEIKTQIRQAVFQSLSDPNRKIRTLCARTLSSIANCDWPEEYPDLLASLISLLSSGSSDAVHGCMQVFTEFIKSDLTEDQILPVLRQLLPVLLDILAAKDKHAAITRARTISVFSQCAESLFMVKDQYPEPIKEATATVLPVWLEAFKTLLASDPQQDVSNVHEWENLAIRIEIFKTLDSLHTSFPRSLIPYLKDYLSSALFHLQTLYPAFVHYYLSSSDSVPTSSEDSSIELPHLICPILDFISAVTRGGRAKDWFTPEATLALTASVFNYVQMTDEDEETWASNANIFVAHEEDETQTYSVRMAGFDLLGCFLERSPVLVVNSFNTTLNQVVQLSQQGRETGKADWWRPLEAALAATGAQAEVVMECIEDELQSGRPSPIDVQTFLSGIIPSILSLSEHPFLQGRAFVFASQYAKLLPSGLMSQYLDAAVQVVEAAEASVPVKISAVRAIHNFFQGSEDETALVPFAPRIAQDLIPLLSVTTDDTLSLVLETISAVVDVEKGRWLTSPLASSLVTAVLDVWQKNSKDPILLSILTDILTSAASVPEQYETIVKQALPTLCHAISTVKSEESWVASSAIELVSSLVTGSAEGHLGAGFFALLAPSLFKCLDEAEDRDVLQAGISCLTLIIRKDVGQVLGWSSPTGGGLSSVLKVVAKILHSPDESGGLVIGDLIIHLIRRSGDAILPVLPEMLQTMVSRMTSAKTVTFLQSLVIPFAYLIYHMENEVMTLLESTNIQGRSGLDILIQTWCENAETFQGFWPTRVSTLALSQLFASGRPTLQTLMVKGDMIVNPETRNVIMTRSRTKTNPHQFTSIPFPLKAFKLLLHDVMIDGESAGITSQKILDGIDSDDGDDEWAEEGNIQGFKPEEFAMLSDMLGPKGVAFDNDDILEDNDDEDLKQDPISQMDMQAHLLNFFQTCASRNTNNFTGLVDQLSTDEALIVRRIVAGEDLNTQSTG